MAGATRPDARSLGRLVAGALLIATVLPRMAGAADLKGDIAAACHADESAHCSGVRPGTADALACLQKNDAVIAPACRTQLARLPTDAEKATLRASCRSDYIAHCLTVPSGTIESLQCLQKAAPSLSPACKSAVTAASH